MCEELPDGGTTQPLSNGRLGSRTTARGRCAVRRRPNRRKYNALHATCNCREVMFRAECCRTLAKLELRQTAGWGAAGRQIGGDVLPQRPNRRESNTLGITHYCRVIITVPSAAVANLELVRPNGGLRDLRDTGRGDMLHDGDQMGANQQIRRDSQLPRRASSVRSAARRRSSYTEQRVRDRRTTDRGRYAVLRPPT